jgi:MFS family permease
MLYSKLPKSIWALAGIDLINGMGSFVFPFLALFLTVKLGYSASYAGTFILLSLAMYAPGSLFSSRLADKMSRKTIMVLFQLLCGVAMIVCGLLMSYKEIVPYFILLIFLFDGASDPARQAIYADHTTLDNRKEAFSLFYLAHNIGFAIGPMIAGLLFNKFPQWLFIGNGITAIVGTLCITVFIEDKKPTEEEIEESYSSDRTDKAIKGSVLAVLKEKPLLTMYIFIFSLFGLAYSMYFFTMPLYLANIFNEIGPTYFGTVMSFNAITVIIATPLLIKFSTNKHPLRLMGISMFLYGISFILMGLTSTFYLILILTIVYSVGEVFSATNHGYFVTNHIPLGHRARFSSIQTILEGAGFALGPVISGAIIDDLGYVSIFFLAALISFVCLISLQGVRHLYLKKEGTKY